MAAIDVATEAVLGVARARIWTRPTKPAPAPRSRPIEDESFHWIEASSIAGRRLDETAQIIEVSDRESDIYSKFCRTPPGVETIVRVAQTRRLDDDEYLFAVPCDWRELGTMEITVPPRRPGQAARVACVGLKAGRVCIAKPRQGADPGDPATVTLTYVEVSEIDPPKGHTPIIWRLLTTLPLCGAADEFTAAQDIVRLYRLYWRIEQVFRSMKSDGLRLEETVVT